jgi:hypothetical protein
METKAKEKNVLIMSIWELVCYMYIKAHIAYTKMLLSRISLKILLRSKYNNINKIIRTKLNFMYK